MNGSIPDGAGVRGRIHRLTPSLRLVLLAALLAVATAPPAQAITQAEVDALRARINAPGVDDGAAVIAAGMVLRSGPGSLTLRTGRVYPAHAVSLDGGTATAAGGSSAREYVFVGEGILEIAPQDPIEARQLEIFAGARYLREPITAAVMVMANDAAAAAIRARPVVESPAGPALDRAQEILAAWRGSPERRILGAEEAILADLLGDSGAGNVFIGAFQGKNLGRFLLSLEPRAAEQVAMGAFEPYDLTEKERKKIGRMVHREQRRGRLLGVSADTLGRWDSWLSMQTEYNGTKIEGAPSFEPVHYQIEATIASGGDAIDGRARVRLRSMAPGSRVATFDVLPDLLVSAASTGDGTAAPFLQTEGRVTVVLERAPAAGETIEIELRYAGQAFEETGLGGRSFHLRDTLSWHPHAGEEDLATYDVLLRWPKKWELLAVGELQGEGTDGDLRWQRRAVTRPTLGYTFQFGKFEKHSGKAGEVDVTVAIDGASKSLLDGKALLEAVVDTVEYLTGVFGPLPSKQLTIVTSQQDFSQSMLGFVTLSSAMTSDDLFLAVVGAQDPRATIAHEISHQWWGHQIAWRSYRDQWLSEALADYSAALYIREHLAERAEIWNGPLSGWQQLLGAYAANGQSIESLGPVVLGERLSSSLSEEAYQLIVYTKGALVLNVLAQRVGDGSFNRLLRWLAEQSNGRTLSTADFIDVVARNTKLDLKPFADAFVYGTGVPEIEFTYSATKAAGASDGSGDGGGSTGSPWRLTIEAERAARFRFSYRVVRRDDGGLDVVRDVVPEEQPAQPPALAVPFEVVLRGGAERAKHPGKRAKEAAPQDRGKGALLLEGERSTITLDVPAEPESLTLDPDEILLAMFIDVTRLGPIALVRRGYRALASGDDAAATASFRQAIAAELPPAPDLDDVEATIDRFAAEAGVARAHLELARLALDRGVDDDAAYWIEVGKASLEKAMPIVRTGLEGYFLVVESRLDLRRGDARGVARRLEKARDDGVVEAGEAMLLLAIAADGAGDAELFAEALGAARSRSAEVADLTPLLDRRARTGGAGNP